MPSLACHTSRLLYLFEILVILIVTVAAVGGPTVKLACLVVASAYLVPAWCHYFGEDLLD